MILGHTMGHPFIKTFHILHYIFFFYMPWFFFKSGMFFSPGSDFKSFIKKKYDRLIKTFLFFSAIGEFFFFMDSYNSGISVSDWYYYTASVRTLPYLGHFTGNPPCWFLLSLFVIFFIYYFIRNWNKIALISFLFGLLVVNHYFNPFPIYSVVHTVSGCCFFVLGLYLKSIQYKKLTFFTSFIFLLLAIPFNSFVIMVSDLVEKGNYLLWYLFSLCAIIVINNLVKYIPNHLLIYRLFVLVGQNSMLLLVTHWLILIALKIFLLNTGIVHESWQFVLVSVLSIAVLTPILKKLISKIKFIKI